MAKPKPGSEKHTANDRTPAEGNGAGAQASYFLSLSLENVRCFGPRQTLDLSDGNGKPSRWTVILGNNGTGKTTILQSLLAFRMAALKPKPRSLHFLAPFGDRHSFQRD